ncbi:DUF7003 family protein [Flavitalea flava]
MKNNILTTLDNCDQDSAFHFINLEHPYVYLADCRLHLFRDEAGQWAIVSEVLGYNTRGAGWAVSLEIRYFGNCLLPLKDQEEQYNYYTVLPLDAERFNATIDIDVLQPGATSWLVRGVEVPLSHEKSDYGAEGITLKETEPGEITGEEILRFLVPRHRPLFRATEGELYQGIPTTVKKVMVLDEWHHKSFHQMKSPFEDPQILLSFDQTNPMIAEMIQQELEKTKQWNATQWEDRPSSYETWQQIAGVLATGDTKVYRPSHPANTHWKNWPEGGTM